MTLYDNNKKICMLGGTAVGKTCLGERFVLRDKYIHTNMNESTIGASFKRIYYTDSNGINHIFNLWDTAGQERYKSLAPMYYRKSGAVIIVYDVTQPSSWEEAKYWYHSVKYLYDDHDTFIIMVGNKTDLREHTDTHVKASEVTDYCNFYDLKHFECSVKTGYNIEEILAYLCSELYNQELDSEFVDASLSSRTNSIVSLDEEEKDNCTTNICGC